MYEENVLKFGGSIRSCYSERPQAVKNLKVSCYLGIFKTLSKAFEILLKLNYVEHRYFVQTTGIIELHSQIA